MDTLVMKFGGASMARIEQFEEVALIIKKRRETCSRIVVVVSAMGTTTDELLALARLVHPNPPSRELDMLVSVGERVSMALLAMALDALELKAKSFTGSQAGIITTSAHSQAQILEVRPKRLEEPLNRGEVVIVAGFQGMSKEGEITTLSRGGSDTSAVAIAVSLQASKVEFYKDVPGIASSDPKKEKECYFFPFLSYGEARSIVEGGAKVLHKEAIDLAEKGGVSLHVRSFHHPEGLGSMIGREVEGCV